METKENIISPVVFNDSQKHQIESLLFGLSEKQVVWLAGYLTGISQSSEFITNINPKSDNTHSEEKITDTGKTDLTIIYGSRTGNGEQIAKQLKAQAENNGFEVHFYNMGDYPLQKLPNEKNLLIIVSTHGEGEPPIVAEEFYEFVHGKRAKPFENTQFSILALGDKSYVHFCKTGKDLDDKLEKLGAKRIYPRTDCDIDFHSSANQWITGVLNVFIPKNAKKQEISIKQTPANKEEKASALFYNQQNPFKSKVLEKIKLNGKGSTKEIYHYELSIEKSGINYEPGDAVGIYAANPERLVHELSIALHLNPAESIVFEDIHTSLGDVLSRKFEISSLNADIINKYNEFAQSKELSNLFKDPKKLSEFTYNHDLVDLITKYPVKISTPQLLNLLRKIKPRLYSISSSLQAFPEEVHLTISTIRYLNQRYKEGVCSTYLSDRLGENESILLYPERNPDFRLPDNTDTPIIMVGPGTGIAPFRAFLQEREVSGAKGKNWLFFGDRSFTTDFLYQTELQSWHKKGHLTNLNVAFSQDTNKKIYVQHRIQEHSKELVKWIEDGAHFYVCGNASNMGNDVHHTLINIISQEKKISLMRAEEYVKSLKKAKRYQTDVY